MKLFYLFKIAWWFCVVGGEEYNLFGDAGQAYSLEIYMGHPKQKVPTNLFTTFEFICL